MMMVTQSSQEDRKTCRPYAFSIRTVLVPIVIVGSLLAYLSNEMRQAAANRNAQAECSRRQTEIAHLGGVAMTKQIKKPNTLERWIGDPGLYVIYRVKVLSADFSDRQLRDLRQLESLEELDLRNTQVTDKGLAHLKGMRNLRSLLLGYDRHIILLKGAIDERNLPGAKITDAGIAQLSEIVGLQGVMLYGTNISDTALDHLERLPDLKWLNIIDTELSEAAVANFRIKHPDCDIKP